MASIIDSYREVFSDNLSFLKLLVFAIPVYYAYVVFQTAQGNYLGFSWLVGLIIFFLFGLLIEVAGNVINESNKVLPSLNPFPMALTSLKGIVALAPSTLISYFLVSYICSFINIILWLDIILKSILWVLAASIIVASFLMFSRQKKISSAFKLKEVSEKAGDLLVVILFFILQLVLINILTTGFSCYAILVLFGAGPVLYAFLAYALVFNIAVTGHYFAQAHYEIFTFDKSK